ncbi:hypothetical protein AMS68_001201 [Peltaster fructicola]|uniref:Transmembrane protein 135 N-terminal domain-containing protein n=1 Tax=Peltaster fructicola TaxID=286661 RepID=A0A6H0XLT2_9PEZI|nr:hypothetical protein AMS68_001201 [Peltaster fructicola]
MSAAASANGAAPPTGTGKRALDPVTRNALRYTISPKEYELLHQYLISRAPARIKQQAPAPQRFERITRARTETGEYNIASFRAAFRVFAAAYIGLKGYEKLSLRLERRRRGISYQPPVSPFKHKHARVALSFSAILLFHRLLHRFFKRLRAALLEQSAESFRERNPTVTRLLTSQYTPAVGASLAGLFLGVSPSDQLRLTITIYAFSRSLEFGYNALTDAGYVWKSGEKPWWFGSWLIMPFAAGQLLHAFVFDRDCFPESYGKFILARSPEYIQLRPVDLPKNSPWPGTFDIVDALADLSKQRWPAFVSPIMFPTLKNSVSPALAKVTPITAPAHPAHTFTSCAVLHPNDPSCARVYLRYWFAAFPSIARFFTIVYGAFALLAYKSALKAPLPFLNKLSGRILRISLFITGSIGTSWASICLFNNYLSKGFMPTQRWFLGGFLGGMWAFLARHDERSTFLYSMRMSLDSLWKVGKKHGWWRGIPNGDVLVFMMSLALINFVYEVRPGAVNGGVLRKTLSSLRGEGWVDRSVTAKGDASADKHEVNLVPKENKLE